jgi:hypothetical protein
MRLVKINGTATGYSEGLKIQPVVFHNRDEVFFVVRAIVRGVDHPVDKDDLTFRRHDLKIEDMAPVDRATAEKALQEYAQEIERIKAEADGQLMLDAEAEAEAREELDGTGTPAEVAEAAAARVKG